LLAHPWTGNLRELEEVVRQAHAQSAGPRIQLSDLPPRLELAAKAALQPRRAEEKIVLEQYLAGIELELIQRALSRSKGNKAKAARLLGMTRPRLYRRLVQLGLEPPEAAAE
jgi:DNA-binding NtrC family response regulator